MLQEQQLIGDTVVGAFVDELTLEFVRHAVLGPAEPPHLEWSGRSGAVGGQGRTRVDDGGGLHAAHDSRGPDTARPPGAGGTGRHRSVTVNLAWPESTRSLSPAGRMHDFASRGTLQAPYNSACQDHMSSIHIRPRSSIADAELARAAVVDLPMAAVARRPRTPRVIVDAVAAFRRPVEPERVIVLRLSPVVARPRR
jgi:hypothetical protein